MYTICSGCHRQFRIRAVQLSAAQGQVKCGYCGHQFNALLQLSDRPHKQEVLSKPIRNEQPTSARPTEVSDNISIKPDSEKIVERDDEAVEFSFELPDESIKSSESKVVDEPISTYSFSESDSDSKEDEKSDEFSGLSQAAIDTLEAGKNQQAETSDTSRSRFEFPEQVILEEPEPRRSYRSMIYWILGTLILLIILLTQYAWFQRDFLLERYPQFYPYANQMCERLGCQLKRVEKADAIKVLNRDVRLHPAYRDTLLVNATIVNQTDQSVPFPMIQLTLFNTAGETISYQRFEPAEYLDQSMNQQQGMIPQQPVHFALELTGKIDNAVSFEFDFF